MIPNNNLSVLPFYDSIERQNARKWWMYGNVYPLFVPSGFMLPFQVMRPARTERVKGDKMNPDDADVGYLTADGSWYQNTSGGYVQEYDVTGMSEVYLSEIAHEMQSGEYGADAVSCVAYNSSDAVLATKRVKGNSYTGFWELPNGTTKIRVQTRNADVGVEDGEVYATKEVLQRIKNFKIYKSCGELTDDLVEEIYENGLKIKHLQAQNIDVIVYPFGEAFTLDDGQYYVEMSDGTDTWFSEVFTVSKDAASYLKIEWWDDSDLVMDAGTIVYSEPAFKNVIYLPSDVAKPEYDFEEESEERDGYTFPLKQISKKVYHFSFFASEYMLDVMRFIRMSDHVVITYAGQEYSSVDSFLISPEWEDYGDVATVDAEFTTATVAKKIGRGILG